MAEKAKAAISRVRDGAGVSSASLLVDDAEVVGLAEPEPELDVDVADGVSSMSTAKAPVKPVTLSSSVQLPAPAPSRASLAVPLASKVCWKRGVPLSRTVNVQLPVPLVMASRRGSDRPFVQLYW